MTSFPVYFTNLRCDGCGKVIKVMGETAPRARQLASAAGWRAGREPRGKGRHLFDACRDCELPEGYTEL